MKKRKIIGYKIVVRSDEYWRWRDLLFENPRQSLAPEILGMLLGNAKPIYKMYKEEIDNQPQKS